MMPEDLFYMLIATAVSGGFIAGLLIGAVVFG